MYFTDKPSIHIKVNYYKNIMQLSYTTTNFKIGEKSILTTTLTCKKGSSSSHVKQNYQILEC